MSCSNHQLQISAALDGPLSAAEEADLQEHLAACGVCRGFQAEQKELGLFVRAADPDLDAPARIWQRIEKGIQERQQQPVPSSPRHWSWARLKDAFAFPQWSYALAGLVLAAAMSLTIFNWNNSADLDAAMLAELDSYQPDIPRNPWISDPFFQATHDQSRRNPFSDVRSEK